ncbi:MAG: protein kinase domain-containing protein [Pyrinomonadaceae bacterium]
MSPERWQQVEEIFQTALDLAPDERAPYVAETCAGDDELRQQIDALLAQYEAAGDFLTQPVLDQTGLQPAMAALLGGEDDQMIGQHVGAYRIERELGRGGMGAVYLAARADNAFQRRVAVKVIKRGMDTDDILRRFRHERQILAALDHPNIARLLDGGATDRGQPYFVMEYIAGQPLYQYCDARRLNIRERLRLFCQVCEAVGYAHENQVIHRDIKPSNVLVTTAGIPKLFDFGIAKLLNPELAPDTSPQTATAMRLMTVEYASPEQVQGLPVTYLSDVYSLGVLLYELLSGHRPYRFPSRLLHDMARVITEEEPELPSTAVTRTDTILPVAYVDQEAQTIGHLCELRADTPENLHHTLAGALDNITLKALRKNPAERYQSAAALCTDLARYLEGQPISAPAYFPPAKTARTWPQAESVEQSIAVLPFKLIGASETDDTGDKYLSVGLADALITRLSNVRRFEVRPTGSVLRYGEATDALAAGRTLGVDFIVAGTIRRAASRIRVNVQLLSVRAGATRWAGKFDEEYTDVLQLEDSISEQVARAIVPQLTGDERQQLAKRGTDNPEAYEAYLRGRYHWITLTEEGFAKAITCYYRAIALDPEYAAAYAAIAEYQCWLAIFGVLPPAECLAAARDAARRAVELDDTLAEAHAALGFALLAHKTQWDAAIVHHRRALELNPHYATARVWYAGQLAMEGRFDEADAEMARACELDPLNPFNAYNRVWYLYQARRYEESISRCRDLIRSDPRYGPAYFALSWALRRVGAYEEAINAARKAIEYGGQPPHSLAALGAAYAEAGRSEEARGILVQLHELAAERFVTPYHRALVHLHLGEHDAALDLLAQSVAAEEPWLVWLGVEPQFDALRLDARFVELLQRTGNQAPPPAPNNQTFLPVSSGSSGPTQLPNAAPNVAPKRPTTDEEAHQFYVAGRYYATKRTAEGLRLGIERLERAVERDPQFALAFAEMADCYALLNWYIEPPPADAWARAKDAAQKAVAADDTLAEGHAALGFVLCHHDRDGAAAERELRRAVELRPENTVARRWHAFNLSAMGRHDDAIAEIKRAQELAPHSPVTATAVANVLFLARRFDECIAQCRKALELDAGSVAAYVVLRWAYELKGLHKEALAAFEQERVFAGETPTTRAKHAHVLAATGRGDEARPILAGLLAHRAEQWVTAYEIAIIYTLLGDRDDALDWLAEAEREHAVGFTFVRVDPHLDGLRSDPRFAELLRQTYTPTA